MFRATLLGLSLLATPAFASAHYQAQPAAAPTQAKLVLRDTVWKRDGAGYTAGKSSSRPAIVCAVLAKEVGELRSFSVAGQPLSAAELEKCNARAK